MNAHERQLVLGWILKNVGISFLLFLFLSFQMWANLIPFDNLVIFAWFFFAGQVLLFTASIALDVFGHQRVLMIAELKEKKKTRYTGNAITYKITLENEEHHRTFEVTQDKWEKLKLGVIYEMVYLKNSQLVLALKPTIVEIPAPETPALPRFDTLHGENE
jgi:hypothetical protein